MAINNPAFANKPSLKLRPTWAMAGAKAKKIISSIFVVAAFFSTVSMFSMNIFDAIKKGDVKQVERLITEKKIDVNKVTDKYGHTPFCLAYWRDEIKIVKLLLPHCKKITINKGNNHGVTPLHFACLKKNFKMARLLLEKGAKETVNKADEDENTPLYLSCCKKNNLDIVKLLLINGAHIDDTQIYKIRTSTISKYNFDPYKIYLYAALDYNKSTDKINFILSKKNDKSLFNFLVKVAFGKTIPKNKNFKYTLITKNVFSELYKKLDKKDLEEAFGIPYNEDIFKFIKNIIKNKNCRASYLNKV